MNLVYLGVSFAMLFPPLVHRTLHMPSLNSGRDPKYKSVPVFRVRELMCWMWSTERDCVLSRFEKLLAQGPGLGMEAALRKFFPSQLRTSRTQTHMS